MYMFVSYQCSHSLMALIASGKGSATRLAWTVLVLCCMMKSFAKPSRTYGRTSMSFCTSPASTMGHYGGLFLALFVGSGECLKNRHNRLICKSHQSCVLGVQTAAQIVKTGSQFVHDSILRQSQVDFQLMNCLYKCVDDMHGYPVIICVHGVLVTLPCPTKDALYSKFQTHTCIYIQIHIYTYKHKYVHVYDGISMYMHVSACIYM